MTTPRPYLLEIQKNVGEEVCIHQQADSTVVQQFEFLTDLLYNMKNHVSNITLLYTQRILISLPRYHYFAGLITFCNIQYDIMSLF